MQNKALYIPHGGGPIPLITGKDHEEMISFLKAVPKTLGDISCIVVISAHWEADVVTITSGGNPPLIYDYSGFPDESYEIQYPAPGNPGMANKIHQALREQGVEATLDATRGFDHGLFVPLKLMFPEANIPCVQLSLVRGLKAAAHINLGQALASLDTENVLFLGSGLSFHNMQAFFGKRDGAIDEQNEAFEDWLVETCTSEKMSEADREHRLIEWESEAPYSRYCHPREEHLLPLHVCAGLAGRQAEKAFDGQVLGKRTTGYLWELG
jgi:4,5-DOPA dioxygenase extradiol